MPLTLSTGVRGAASPPISVCTCPGWMIRVRTPSLRQHGPMSDQKWTQKGRNVLDFHTTNGGFHTNSASSTSRSFLKTQAHVSDRPIPVAASCSGVVAVWLRDHIEGRLAAAVDDLTLPPRLTQLQPQAKQMHHHIPSKSGYGARGVCLCSQFSPASRRNQRGCRYG